MTGYVQILDDDDMAWAESVGVLRRYESSRNKHIRKNRHVSLEQEIAGAQAELAFERWRGEEWKAGINTFHAPDCGQDIQVRHTVLNFGGLVFRPVDPVGHRYVLVTGVPPKFTIRGWRWGRDCMRDQWWDTIPNGREPCWLVPQKFLEKSFDSIVNTA